MILTFSLGIRGSYIPDRWTATLNELGMSGTRVEKLMEGMVSQALKELTAIYSISLHPATPRGGDQAVMPTPRGRRRPPSLQGGGA